MTIKKLFALFLSIALLSACSPKADKELVEGFTRYINSEKGIAIQYPEEWMLNESTPGTLVSFMSPMEGDADLFQENLNLAVQDMGTESYDLQEFTELSVNQIAEIYPDIAISKSAVELDGNEAFEVVYDFEQFNFHFKSMQVYTIVDNKVFIVTFVAENDTYDEYVSLVKKMVDSVEIL